MFLVEMSPQQLETSELCAHQWFLNEGQQVQTWEPVSVAFISSIAARWINVWSI